MIQSSSQPSQLKIRCQKCDRRVDQVVIEYSHGHRGWIITAYCHGDRETMQLGDEIAHITPDLERQLRAQEGLAFRASLVAGPQP